jgi:hypothetical protein
LSGGVPFWLQVASVVLAPVLGLAGVGAGAALTSKGEHRRWVREERLRVYADFVSACTGYLQAAQQVDWGIVSGSSADQEQGRDQAIAGIKNVEARREAVLLIGSAQVRDAARQVVEAAYGVHELVRDFLRRDLSRKPDWDDAQDRLRGSLEAFRVQVQREILPG